jgi:hypothetical protein
MPKAKLPSRAEFQAVFEAELRTQLDPTGTRGVNLRAGSRNGVMVSMATLGASRVAGYVADRVAARSRRNATGTDLDDLARDIYNTERKAKKAATGRLYLTRTNTAATYLPKGSRIGIKATDTQPAVTYEMDEDVSVALSALTASVKIRCQTEGVAGNNALSLIDQILDPLPDSSWVINTSPTNPEDLGGGAEDETDDQLQRRLDELSLDDTRQRGTVRAIRAAIGAVPGTMYWNVIEPFDGSVIAYVGDSAYALPVDLQNAIVTASEDWRAFGLPLLLRKYNAQKVNVNGTIYMQKPLKNYDQSALMAIFRAAVKLYFATGRENPDEYYVDGVKGGIVTAAKKLGASVQKMTFPSLTDTARPADAGYGTVSALNRYIVDDSTIALALSGPATT